MRALSPTRRMLVIDRKNFVLRLYKRRPLSNKLRFVKEYQIATGRFAYPTPPGVYDIQGRSDCPDWRQPESKWVPRDQWGEVIPCGDPRNPIRYRWLGIWPEEGVGIHGIPPEEEDSIPGPHSHGCIRMHKRDVLELYDQVPRNTPVVIL